MLSRLSTRIRELGAELLRCEVGVQRDALDRELQLLIGQVEQLRHGAAGLQRPSEPRRAAAAQSSPGVVESAKAVASMDEQLAQEQRARRLTAQPVVTRQLACELEAARLQRESSLKPRGRVQRLKPLTDGERRVLDAERKRQAQDEAPGEMQG